MKLFRKKSELLKDEKGATAIEFAILIGPFLILMFGIIQVGILFLTNQALDSAVDNAGRLVRTGQIDSGTLSLGDFRIQICNSLPIVRDCNSVLQISVDSFSSIAATRSAPLYNAENFPIITSSYDTGVGGNVVVINAAVTVPIVAGDFILGQPDSGSARLTTSVVFTNENF